MTKELESLNWDNNERNKEVEQEISSKLEEIFMKYKNWILLKMITHQVFIFCKVLHFNLEKEQIISTLTVLDPILIFYPGNSSLKNSLFDLFASDEKISHLGNLILLTRLWSPQFLLVGKAMAQQKNKDVIKLKQLKYVYLDSFLTFVILNLLLHHLNVLLNADLVLLIHSNYCILPSVNNSLNSLVLNLDFFSCFHWKCSQTLDKI